MEEKLPWIRRRLKKRSYRVEKHPKRPCCLFWYEKLSNSLFGNTFEELELTVNELQSEDKLSSLLQGLEVIKVSFGNNKCIFTHVRTYMYIDFWTQVNILTVTYFALTLYNIYESREAIIFLLLVVFIR